MLKQDALRAIPLLQLRELNRMVVTEIRERNRVESIRAGSAFNVGDKLTFWSPKRGRQITIRAEKINAQSINGVCVDTGGKWKVHPSLLRRVV